MICKKITGSIMVGCLISGLILTPLAAYADVAKKIMPFPVENGDPSKAQFPLEKAIEKAKDTFEIDNSYDRFESNLNFLNQKLEWSLNWSRSKEPGGNIIVRINAMTGQIVGMDRWDPVPGGNRYIGLPKYSYDDGSKLAGEWVKKLMPDYSSQVSLSSIEQPSFGLGERGPAEYYYNYNRLVNGIAFPENNISVRINGDTGQLIGIGLNWEENLAFPSPEYRIPATDAEKIMREQVELNYFFPRFYGAKEGPVKLVYLVDRGSGLYIDALSGKIVDYPAMHPFDRGMGGAEKSARQELTPSEQAEVDRQKKLISSEQAIKMAKQFVQIPADLKQTESHLNPDYQFPQVKLWNLTWSAEGRSINVGIDAESGQLISFYSWDSQRDQQYNKAEPRYTREQAKKIVEDYLVKQQPQHFSEVKLQSSGGYDYIAYKDKMLPRNYLFSYTRLVNGVPFPGNGFEVQVDPYTGEITNYRMNWWGLTFPNTANAIGQSQAADKFLEGGGLELNYMRIAQDGKANQVYLVYRLTDRKSYTMDAFSGNYLDWQGNPLPDPIKLDFKDISGIPEESDIRLLGKSNIVKSEDGSFYPERNITKLEVLEWLVASRGYAQAFGQSNEQQRDSVINQAINLGIIDQGETQDVDSEITRLELAKLMINTLDYDGAAKIKGIYTLWANDAGQVSDDMVGYAALAMGLGLQNLNNGLYQPEDKVSRASAASSLVRLLNVRK